MNPVLLIALSVLSSGTSRSAANEPPVRIFVMGTGDGHKDQNGRLFHGGYRREESEWPLRGTRFVPYYFRADGTLQTRLTLSLLSA